MQSLSVVIFSQANKAVWSEWVEKHPQGNIFQAPEYYEVNRCTKNYTPFCYALTDSNDTILGLVNGVIIRNFFVPISYFTSRAIVQGGPLFAENLSDEEKRSFLSEVIRLLEKDAVYIQIRNMWDTKSDEPAYKEVGFKYESHLDIRNNLLAGKKEVISSISKNKRRNITKTENKGTTFVELTQLSEIKDSLSLIRTTYKRVGLPLVDNSHFTAAFTIFFRNICGYLLPLVTMSPLVYVSNWYIKI